MKNNIISRIFNLKGRTIILTGSAGLLGTEYAHILSEAGANLILVDIQETKNKKLEKILRQKYGTNPMAVSTDITNESQVHNLKKTIIAKYGRIDGLINNAFFNHAVKQSKTGPTPIESFPLEIWNKSMEINLTAVFLCCKEFGSDMAQKRNGVIVNISSIYGIVGADQRIYGKSGINSPISYASSKGAIVNMTRYLTAYWHGKNVRVNTLTLGGVQDDDYQTKDFIKNYSNKTILNRMAKKDDYIGAMLFLMSDASSYMTGSNVIVDGGWTAW